MFSRSQKRVVIGAAIFVVFVLFAVPYIRVSQYKLSVANALSQALGRAVSVQDVSIRTFPQPGLLLSRVVVADDPSISAEPLLRADSVLATIRVTSLWRWRLEIATLKLSEPSVNLVRTADGRWNLESLLERVRQLPSAPTAKARPETRPRFPYIEADTARINLKLGQEKKAFAFNDADFSLWLASEDEWQHAVEGTSDSHRRQSDGYRDYQDPGRMASRCDPPRNSIPSARVVGRWPTRTVEFPHLRTRSWVARFGASIGDHRR